MATADGNYKNPALTLEEAQSNMPGFLPIR